MILHRNLELHTQKGKSPRKITNRGNVIFNYSKEMFIMLHHMKDYAKINMWTQKEG